MQKVQVFLFPKKPKRTYVEGWCFRCQAFLFVPSDLGHAPVCTVCAEARR